MINHGEIGLSLERKKDFLKRMSSGTRDAIGCCVVTSTLPQINHRQIWRTLCSEESLKEGKGEL